MAGQRNHWGNNDLCDLYRTVDGVRFVYEAGDPTPDRLKQLRTEGVRCRSFMVDGGRTLFVHPDDAAKTSRILGT